MQLTKIKQKNNSPIRGNWGVINKYGEVMNSPRSDEGSARCSKN